MLEVIVQHAGGIGGTARRQPANASEFGVKIHHHEVRAEHSDAALRRDALLKGTMTGLPMRAPVQSMLAEREKRAYT